MKHLIIHLFFAAVCILIAEPVLARENTGIPVKREEKRKTKMKSGCLPATASIDLDINNVRARIMNGGDMWWDLVGTPRYEIPKVTDPNEVRRHSLFAGALWIGGLDAGGNLKAAAMTYRQQSGYDFFPGPLDTSNASIQPAECLAWDKIWEVTREEIDAFREDPTLITEGIRDWPAHGDPASGQARYLAPFVDVDGDGQYDPIGSGDYPDVFGDQSLFFIYNDKGNIHTETQADAIGLELHTQAFAFATNDEINNMTFYWNKVINRSRDKIDSVYFGQWVDADLGYAYDDYVGVDVDRSLGFCYNGDNFDDGVTGYGANPPSVGVDFFQGPTDPNGNELGLTYFVYYNNDFTRTGNPSEPIHYYWYLTGRWKNGDPITKWGDGATGTEPTPYMFPDDPRDPSGWSEVTSGNRPGDRRFLQSSGPFELMPGAVNYVITGVVWARASTGGATGSLDLLKLADDKAQSLFDNQFRLIDGPDAPDLEITELDRQLILTLASPEISNFNYKRSESYRDSILERIIDTTGVDSVYTHYRFQGYQIYQLKSSNVTPSELNNPDRARLIIQVDVQDGVTRLVNRVTDPILGVVPVEMVNGEDQGIKHSFSITQDMFAGGDDSLVNFKSYHYMVIAYANADDPNEPIQYLGGRRNVNSYRGIPHKTAPHFGGNILGAKYGDGPRITRIQGQGNGGNSISFTPETHDQFFSQNTSLVPNPEYRGGQGPVDIKVIDPLKVPPGNFKIEFIDATIPGNPVIGTPLSDNARWRIINTVSNDTIFSDTTVGASYEQVLAQLGLSITTRRAFAPGNPTQDATNGFISASIAFSNAGIRWLGGLPDGENFGGNIVNPNNWIRSGRVRAGSSPDYMVDDAFHSVPQNPGEPDIINYHDPSEVYERGLNNIIAPYPLVSRSSVDATTGRRTLGPAYTNISYNAYPMSRVHSIDLVLTNDKSKWTRCVVIETGEDQANNVGGAAKFDIRKSPSIGKDGKPDGTGTGMSWFPGYAVDLETGERLNIIFGEESFRIGENGADMMWNPTGNVFHSSGSSYQNYLWGGKHFVYVMAPRGGSPAATDLPRGGIPYDEGAAYKQILENYTAVDFRRRQIWGSVMWTMIPIVQGEFKVNSYDQQNVLPTDVTIRARVSQPLAAFPVGPNPENRGLPVYNFSTDDVALVKSTNAGKEALKMVNVVPNPYYAYSSYETSQLDSRVRITNLPPTATISIYTLAGKLVRRYEKANTEQTYLDWDLNNTAAIPVASGLYIIHVDAGELGTKTLKWFGVMRPLDLDTF